MCALKKPLLDLPIKVILTEEGASHFISKKKKLLRFRLADNLEEYGIKFNSFAPISLQQMILVDYISKIEKLTSIDTRTKTLLKQYLQTKITETKKQNQNN